jgi:undecaprenyl-diphosphatase
MVRHFITASDHSLMRRLHRWRAPRWFRIWMIGATRAGDGWLWCALAAVFLLFGGPQRFRAVGAASLAAGAGILLFLFLKKRTGRQRPCDIEPHVWATLLPPDHFSFPSGHTITAFSITVAVSLFYPDLVIPMLFCAFSIALSRIVLGMHFLSDVLAGALIGVALAYGAVWLLR